MHECIWCSRKFTPRTVGANYYRLLSAGVEICWDCADLYEAAEVKMHFDCLRARVDRHMSTLLTENGSKLPFTIESWTKPRTRWGKTVGRAVDAYGRMWSIRPDSGYARLKPVGDTILSRMPLGRRPAPDRTEYAHTNPIGPDMNAVPLTPAEIKARNKRAAEIMADHRAKPQARQRASATLATSK